MRVRLPWAANKSHPKLTYIKPTLTNTENLIQKLLADCPNRLIGGKRIYSVKKYRRTDSSE
jgi:hypothetical protein